MTAQLLLLLVPVTVFVGLGLAMALLGFLQYRLAAKVRAEWRVALALFIVGCGALLSVALLSRSLNEDALEGGGVVLYEDYAGGFAASRWFSLLLLCAALVEIIRGWVRGRMQAEPDRAWPVLASMLAYYVGTLLIQALFSEHVGISYKDLYVPILLIAVYYQQLTNLRSVLGAAKAVIMVLTLGSLIGIAVRPDFVLHRPEPGVIPGIDWRLFGLTQHANTLGPVALLGLVLECYLPYRRRWLRWLNLAAATAVLILAQSRTAWIAGLLIGVLVNVPLLLAPARDAAGDPSSGFGRAVWTLVICIALTIVLACGLVALGGTEYLQRKTDLGTLNGRFQIWDITLQAWRDNMLFGYGREIWGEERRLRFNMFHVGQAHNQAVQTLGEAGLVGLALLGAYLLLLHAAWRHFMASRGLILALLVLLLARCVTEAPMRAEGLLSWSTFLHVLLLAVACHHLRRAERAPLFSVPDPVPDAEVHRRARRGPSRFSASWRGVA